MKVLKKEDPQIDISRCGDYNRSMKFREPVMKPAGTGGKPPAAQTICSEVPKTGWNTFYVH